LESPRLELATVPADESAADVTWKRLALPAGRHVVALNSSGAFGSAKLWPNGYFAELARKIVCATDNSVLVLCGPSEREIARDIVAAADHPRVVGLADEQLSLGLTKACVRRCRLLVTTDSGPRHFAPAFDVPVVTLFGPTHIAWSETHYARATHLQHRVDCGPCQQRVCPLGHHRCMRDLGVDEVFRAVHAQLDDREAHAA
jgi:heptosyltransferase-2